ncbi:MAG: bacterial Ig-like domain-containing protein [Candidatus Scatosoma sp.]
MIENYSDGTFKTLNKNEYTVSDVNTMTAGVKTVTVTKGEFTATFTVTVQSSVDNGGTENNNGDNGGAGENTTEKKGCGGSVAGFSAVTLLLAATAIFVSIKKKEGQK